MSRCSIQRIKAMLLCIVYGVLFVNTVNKKIKACNAFNAMFVETVDTLVFVASYTTPYTEYYEVWKLCSTLYKVASRLNIQLIFNPQKVLESWDWGIFNHTINTICWYCRYRTRISNAFNAIYVDTVDSKHMYTFLPITFLIFNWLSIHKKFWKAETEGFSTIPSMLYMSILSIQDKDL